MKMACSMNNNMITETRFGCFREKLTVANLILIMCTFNVPLKLVDLITKIL